MRIVKHNAGSMSSRVTLSAIQRMRGKAEKALRAPPKIFPERDVACTTKVIEGDPVAGRDGTSVSACRSLGG